MYIYLSWDSGDIESMVIRSDERIVDFMSTLS